MKLFDFQELSKKLLREAFALHDRIMLCLPTGAGKTYTACSIIKDALDLPGSKLILVDREELLGAPTIHSPAQQWSESLDQFGIPFRYIRSRIYKDPPWPSKVYLAMVESFWARLKKNPQYLDELNIKFIVVDEGHKYAFRKLLPFYQGKVLFLSATPLSSNKKNPLNTYLEKLIIPVETPDLILSGRIVGAKTYGIEHDWSKYKLEKKNNGEYTEESQMLHFGEAKLYDGLVEHWKRLAKGCQTVVYNVNIEHSKSTAKNFRDAGFNFQHLDGTMSRTERQTILQEFRDGTIQGLCNVHLLTTGNDERSIECIVLNRKIGLVSTFTQIAGRGARSHVFPDGRRKRHFVCLDMGSNHEQHGVFGERINWRAIFDQPKLAEDSKSLQLKGSILCSKCDGINPDHLSHCVYCKAELVKRKKVNQRSFTDLIKKSPSQLALIKKEKKQNLPSHLQGKQPSSMSYLELTEYAKHMGHQKSWVYVMLKLNRRKR